MHHYDNAPIAGWSGYVTGDGWILFVADNGTTHLHRM